ncbi:MAG TPA: GntR family transcriptional regulator [Trueperaceae bacterium]
MSLGRTLPSVNKETLEEQAYRVLRRAILDGALAEGARLVQEELASLLGTSRIPVRDALRRLEVDGLVESKGRGSYFVRSFGPEEVREIFALRELLEPYAAARAVARLEQETVKELRRLTGSLTAAGETGDGDSYVRANREFHFLLYRASGMERLVRMIDGLWLGQPPFTPLKVPGQIKQSVAEHLALIEVIEQGNVERVEALLRLHVHRSGELLLAHLLEGAPAGSGGRASR